MFKIHKQDGRFVKITDMRYQADVDITDGTGRFGFLAYTLKEQDINKDEKPGCMPFAEQHAGYNEDFTNDEFGTELKIEEVTDGFVLDLTCTGENVDGAGLFLPFNFISRKNGFWQQQFTISSPYHSADGKHHLFYLGRPDGKSIACVVENEIDCFMVNYSPYQGGHFIRGITFWSQLDKAYGRAARTNKHVRVHILAVETFEQTLEKACEIWNCGALYYDRSSAAVGEEFILRTIGNVDKIVVQAPDGTSRKIQGTSFTGDSYGYYKVTPYTADIAGLDCTVFCYDDLQLMLHRATDAIIQNRDIILGKTADGTDIYEPNHLTYRGYKDFNLCEHCMWGWSALKSLLRGNNSRRIAEDVLNLLNIMNPVNNVGLGRCSYDPEDDYNTKGDYRIQEAFNGVNILLDAYEYFKDPDYLELAKNVLRSKLTVDQLEDGGVYRYSGRGEDRHREDYTTVTFMVLPVVNLALKLRQLGDAEAEYFANAAVRMADHMVSRGYDFPTEGGGHPEVNVEVEEGSMSCTALTVMYVYHKLDPKPEYLEFAKNVLAFHDCYSVYTPFPPMFRSSLRWWETIWEGDADGPAICFGHAWTIWRAEAEFWYAMAAYDDVRMLDSYNSFMSNISKTQLDGNMYAIYQYEKLSSPAMEDRGWMMDRSDREGFPRNKDRTLSRYAWARMVDTWFDTVAVLDDQLLMAKEHDGIIIPEFEDFKVLYIGDMTGSFKIRMNDSVQIVSSKNIHTEGKGIVTITVQ